MVGVFTSAAGSPEFDPWCPPASRSFSSLCSARDSSEARPSIKNSDEASSLPICRNGTQLHDPHEILPLAWRSQKLPGVAGGQRLGERFVATRNHRNGNGRLQPKDGTGKF